MAGRGYPVLVWPPARSGERDVGTAPPRVVVHEHGKDIPAGLRTGATRPTRQGVQADPSASVVVVGGAVGVGHGARGVVVAAVPGSVVVVVGTVISPRK